MALEQETDDGENYESAFKTFDASDYSSIGKHLKNYIRDYVPKTILADLVPSANILKFVCSYN